MANVCDNKFLISCEDENIIEQISNKLEKLFEEYLDGAILQPKGVKVVTDGKIITAVGMGAAVEFGLALVRVLKGDEAANALCSAILAD